MKSLFDEKESYWFFNIYYKFFDLWSFLNLFLNNKWILKEKKMWFDLKKMFKIFTTLILTSFI